MRPTETEHENYSPPRLARSAKHAQKSKPVTVSERKKKTIAAASGKVQFHLIRRARKKGSKDPPTHPATHQTLCFTGVPTRPDCYLPNRARLPKRQWAPVPEQHHQRSISTPGVNRPNRPTYAFTVHTRGGGGGGAGDEGSGVNHRISRSRSGRRGRAGERAPASLFSARECFLAPWFSKLSVL